MSQLLSSFDLGLRSALLLWSELRKFFSSTAFCLPNSRKVSELLYLSLPALPWSFALSWGSHCIRVFWMPRGSALILISTSGKFVRVVVCASWVFSWLPCSAWVVSSFSGRFLLILHWVLFSRGNWCTCNLELMLDELTLLRTSHGVEKAPCWIKTLIQDFCERRPVINTPKGVLSWLVTCFWLLWKV